MSETHMLGWLYHFMPSGNSEKSSCDLYFVDEEGSTFSTTIEFKPYFYISTRPGKEKEIEVFLKRQYASIISTIDIVDKEDLEMSNHLSGKLAKYLKISFDSVSQLLELRKVLLPLAEKNKKSNNDRMIEELDELNQVEDNDYQNIESSGTLSSSLKNRLDCLEAIIDIREYDIKYHVRTAIDMGLRVGFWYEVKTIEGHVLIKQRTDLVERAAPRVCAFDIETTKEPFMFPDSKIDRVMMISYMIDGQGYLIVNREEISADVESFSYTPKPEYEGNFEVINVADEKSLLQYWFDHMKQEKPSVYVTYNGDSFDFPFINDRAKHHGINMKSQIGYYPSEGIFKSSSGIHMDCFYWVKRDSYLPHGSHGLKAVTKAKLGFNPVEVDPENMVRYGRENPQYLASYSVSDAVSTYYLYMKYVHPFIFSLCTIIPMPPDDVLRKGSGTLCETLLMVEAFKANVICPNRYKGDPEKMYKGHLLDSDTYIGGTVEAKEAGIFRADIPVKFNLSKTTYQKLIKDVDKSLKHALEVEHKTSISDVLNYDEVKQEIMKQLTQLYEQNKRIERPKIYHFDVGAMYPNIILTNRLQPMSVVDETICASCIHNKPSSNCKRKMQWQYRAEYFNATKAEYELIKERVKSEKFPPLREPSSNYRGQQQMRTFDQLSEEEQNDIIRKRLSEYSSKVYKKIYEKKTEMKEATICMRENPFYVDTVRLFRDRRYEFKEQLAKWKTSLKSAASTEDLDKAKRMIVVYDSLQLAHKCILNSFYGYVMRKAARWYSMEMAGVVTHAGSQIITMAKDVIEGIGIPLELDTDGIWCILPASFPENFTFKTASKSIKISYPCVMLNADVSEKFTNHQYQDLEDKARRKYKVSSVCSIFFEVDGPYKAMVLPASKEKGKGIKKRYAVFNFDGTLAELKGFEIKRRGELKLIKIFQSRIFDGFLKGNTLEEVYHSVADIANHWLDILYSKGKEVEDEELFDLITESSNMSKSLKDYGEQKSARTTTARRLAELFGEQMIKDKGLVCNYVVCCKPEGAPVSERVIPVAIFQKDINVQKTYLRKWMKDPSLNNFDIRYLLDWEYYKERLGSAIQKIITIPAFYQHIDNPVPRVPYPDWITKEIGKKTGSDKQTTLEHMIKSSSNKSENKENNNANIIDIENMADVASLHTPSGSPPSSSFDIPIKGRTTRKEGKKRKAMDLSSSDDDDDDDATQVESDGSDDNMQISKNPKIKLLEKKFNNGTTLLDASFFNDENFPQFWALQKKKWKQLRDLRTKQRTGDITEKEANILKARGSGTGMRQFIRQQNVSLKFGEWHLLQIRETDIPGVVKLFALINNSMYTMLLKVPRRIYINFKDQKENKGKAVVKKVLPRSRPFLNMRMLELTEDVYISNLKEINNLMTDTNVEGVYETQVPPVFRAIIELGCVCSVIPQSRSKVNTSSLSLSDLRPKLENLEYLEKEDLKRAFLYYSFSDTRGIIGIFFFATMKAHIYIIQPFRQADKPKLNLQNMASELQQLYENSQMSQQYNQSTFGMNQTRKRKVSDFSMFDYQCEYVINKKQAFKEIQGDIIDYQKQGKGATVFLVQTSLTMFELVQEIPQLDDYPILRIALNRRDNVYPAMQWIPKGTRRMMSRLMTAEDWLQSQIQNAAFVQSPLGNIDTDVPVYMIDIMYARELTAHNHLLWISESAKPDLGGTEQDENVIISTILKEEDQKKIELCRPGLYHHVCVELTLDYLDVGSIIQFKHLQQSKAATIVAANTIGMISSSASDANASHINLYDEHSMCESAFSILQKMICYVFGQEGASGNPVVRQITANFYRWLKSPHAKLFDPALNRMVVSLMKKVFIHLLGLLQKLGSKIVFANFNTIILETTKDSAEDAQSYIDFVLETVRKDKSNYFTWLEITPNQYYHNLAWMDANNFARICHETNKFEYKWSIVNHFPSAVQKQFSSVIFEYLKTLHIEKQRLISPASLDIEESKIEDAMQIDGLGVNAVLTTPTSSTASETPESQSQKGQYDVVLLEEELEEMLAQNSRYYITRSLTSKLLNLIPEIQRLPLPKNEQIEVSLREENNWNMALDFIKGVCHILQLDPSVKEEVYAMKVKLLKLVQIKEFSKQAEFKNPSKTFVFRDVICTFCSGCKDIDLCREYVIEGATTKLKCPFCSNDYDLSVIEGRLVERLQAKVVAYQVQDFKCGKCNQVKPDYLSEHCECSGQWQCTEDKEQTEHYLHTVGSIAKLYKFEYLQEIVQFLQSH